MITDMLFYIFVLLSPLLAVNAVTPVERAAAKYIQNASGSATFTTGSALHDCESVPACGKTRKASGFTAAMNQLAFGAPPGLGPGDAYGRCFNLTGAADIYSHGSFTGPFSSIVVKVTNLCPVEGNEKWCGQTTSKPTNEFGKAFHFNIQVCNVGLAAEAAKFFPDGHAVSGTFNEVSCKQWSGSDGPAAFKGACLAGETAPDWPAVGCGNQGAPPV